ncbi:MAG: TonB-dependent receptor [Longimicrobiaceae bacterium]
MKRSPLLATLAALAGFGFGLLVTDAAAQVTTGTIRGEVTTADGATLEGAQVTAINEETGVTRGVLADSQGRFTLRLLPPGSYTVVVQRIGYAEGRAERVRVRLGEATSTDFALRQEAIEIEGVTVVAGRELQIDASQTGVAEFISEEQLDNLPTAGRDFTDFISLSGLISPQPEISTGGQFSIGGARTTGTNVQIDGADANNAFFGENRGSSRIPFAFSLESIQELQVITNGYDVEYGKFSGGVINAVTKGGTNEVEGNFFLYGRDAALTGDNFDGSAPQEFNSYQFGGTVSGPIIEDQLHYFVSGDFQRRDQPVFALDANRSGLPAAEINEFLDILANEYGFDVSDQSGVFEETDDQEAVFGRIDYAINPSHRLTVRANYTNFRNQNDRISAGGDEARSMGGTFEDQTLSLVGELNSTLNQRATVYNTLRLHYSDEKRPRPANSSLPSVTVDLDDGSLGYGGNFFGILFANNLEESKFQLTDNLTWEVGNHTLKVGTDNIFANTFNEFWLNGNGFFTFGSLDDFRDRTPGFSLRFVPAAPGSGEPDPNPTAPIADFDTREHAFYLQDEWRATDRLLLMLGLRYDYMAFPDDGEPLSNPEFRTILDDEFGVSTADTPNDVNNFGPRVSFSYDFSGNQTSVLRGGGGLFYGRVPAVLHGNVLSSTPNPLLAIVCIAAATPEFRYEEWQDPDNIPSDCRFRGFQGDPFGIGIVGAPEIATWDPELGFPATAKFNLGYEHQFSPRLQAGVQAIYSQTRDNYHVMDLNLQEPVFFTADGRPVHTEAAGFEPDDAASERDYGVTSEVRRVYHQTDHGLARGFNLKLDLESRPLENLRIGANYTYNRASDNSSFICCTANAGLFDTPTAGDPNFLGEEGDDVAGTWAPSDFERRHVIVGNAIWALPADFNLGVIYRAQSGNPFTPTVSGDINADGNDGNDRPFIPDPDIPIALRFENPAELEEYRQLVAQNDCLRENVGRIIGRNVCRNPWWHSLNVKASKGFSTFGGQKLEVVLDLFNLLDAFGLEAGELVFKRRGLFRAEGFDPTTNEVIYSVDNRFGQRVPLGAAQLQFQAQLGLRYTF